MQDLRYFVKIAKRDFGLQIVNMRLPNWKEVLFGILKPPFVKFGMDSQQRGQQPLEVILDMAKEKLGAQTLVVEDYISTDWNSERGAVYSRTFEDPRQFTQRIHFFSAIVSYKNLYRISKRIRNAYCGYTIIRPISAFRVGDTVIAPPCTIHKNMKNDVHCLEEFNVSLLGNRLSVLGMPFFQQDTTVGVCAEANLWMIARYMNKKGETGRYRPAEITSLANRTLTTGPGRRGLFEEQMMDALRHMELNPVPFEPEPAKNVREFLYTCVESELPVITGIPEHVFVVIGHDYKEDYKFGNGISSMSEAIESFWVHNDAEGPYLQRRIDEITKEVCLAIRPENTNENKENEACEEWERENVELLTLDEDVIDFLLVAYPERVHLYFLEALETTKTWLDEIRSYIAGLFDIEEKELWSDEVMNNLVLRAYLRLSSDFKADIDDPNTEISRSKEVIARYKTLQMPKYVWVVELALVSDLSKTSLSNRKIRGEILIDSTGNRHVAEEILISFHLDGIMFVTEGGSRRAELIVFESRPYTPLLRNKKQYQA